MIDPAWVAVVISVFVYVGSGFAVFAKISYGQGKAQERETIHTEQIATIDLTLKDIKGDMKNILNGESKCKLIFATDIAELKRGEQALQAELTEEKQNRREDKKG